MNLYPYDTALARALLEVMEEKAWRLPDLIRWLGLPAPVVSRMLSGPGNASAEERSILLRKLAPLTWGHLSGEDEQEVIIATRALMQRMRDKTLWGRIRKAFRR